MQTHLLYFSWVKNAQCFIEQVTAIMTTITATNIAATTTPPMVTTLVVDSKVAMVGGIMSDPAQIETICMDRVDYHAC